MGFVDELQGASEKDWKQLLKPEQLQVLDDAKQTGVLQSFEVATKAAKVDQIPRNIERFFLNWLRAAKPMSIPSFALDQFVRDFNKARIQFCGAQGIGVVLANGIIRQFIPTHVVVGRAIRDNTGGLRARVDAEKTKFNNWTRTRFGFVAGKGALYENLKRCSIGEFSNPKL